MKKIWFDEAWEDYLFWQTQDKKTLRRINLLLRDIERGRIAKISASPSPCAATYPASGTAASTTQTAWSIASQAIFSRFSPAKATMTSKARAPWRGPWCSCFTPRINFFGFLSRAKPNPSPSNAGPVQEFAQRPTVHRALSDVVRRAVPFEPTLCLHVRPDTVPDLLGPFRLWPPHLLRGRPV